MKSQLNEKLYIGQNSELENNFSNSLFFEKIKKNLKNFQKTIAKYGKVYYNLTEVVKSGTKWDISEVNFEC